MLYSGGMNKINVPEQIDFRNKEYSFREDMKVNGWMLVALVISVASEICSDQVKTWFPPWRAVLAIAPFPALLIWVRDLTRWIRGMDELHQRITVATSLFAVSATLFVVTLWNILAAAGIWQHFFQNFFFAPKSVWMILGFITIFYFQGYRIFNRRYR
jgi:hypothetical protein